MINIELNKIELNKIDYNINLSLFINSNKYIIKKNIKNILNLCNEIINVIENFNNIAMFKNKLSNYVLSRIKYDNLFIKNKKSIILISQLKILFLIKLPDEIKDIIIIYLF